MMRKDIRDTPAYQEVETLYQTLYRPSTGQISDAAEVHVSPDGQQVVFAGTLMGVMEGAPPTRICQLDLITRATRLLTFGPNTDRLPRYSPDGRHVAFLSDRRNAGDFQLYLLDLVSGAAQSTPLVDGWVEYLQWSPDGRRILLGVAGHGADISGGQGAVTSRQVANDAPSWMPVVETGDESYRWRHLWIYELTGDRVYPVNCHCNIWEAAWCGDASVAAVVSSGPSEGLWYGARLHIIDIDKSKSQEIYTPRDQIGKAAASPSGEYLVIVEAVCSDRCIVAGDLRLIDTTSGRIQRIDTHGVDITYTEWRSDRRVLLAGQRGFETVIGLLDVASQTFTEVWCSRDCSTGGFCVGVAGFNETGDCALIGESFTKAPEVAVIRQGEYQPVRSFDLGYADHAKAVEAVECVSWQAPDGLEIQGWLLLPKGNGPHPLVMNVHGGPVSHWRQAWLGRSRGLPILMLIKRGYAVFLPNPRGSSGRGQDFARQVLGDMGGADTYDYLSGLDHLVEQGIADPKRLGVTGVSYGGFMASWLITQDPRFAAAVPVAPVTNKVSQHLICNIPQFVALFLADHYANPGGKYFQRSPIMHAKNVKTPTLNICGALDRCTPPEEAVQFHNALLENGVESALVIYPEEGHGVRKLPAAIDYAARLVAWFEKHMPVQRSEMRSLGRAQEDINGQCVTPAL